MTQVRGKLTEAGENRAEFYRDNPALAVADALQIHRISGTDEHLNSRFSPHELQRMGEQVVSYLGLYQLAITPTHSDSPTQVRNG